MPEENDSQEIPITENTSKDDLQVKKSTTDSPLKDSSERHHLNSPHVEQTNPVDWGPKTNDITVVEHGPVARDQMDQAPDGEKQQPQQDQNNQDQKGPSRQPSPSSDRADMSHYFESSNEEDISAQPGGSSIDHQSSTSKISAAAGIPESLLQGLDVSTPEEALEKLLSGVASTQTVNVLQLAPVMMRQLGSSKHT
jgi:hypothetical protein